MLTNEASTSKTQEIHLTEKQIPDKEFIRMIEKFNFQKWYVHITLIVENIEIGLLALLDSGADPNYLKEGIIPTKFCSKTNEMLLTANGTPLQITHKLSKAAIHNNAYSFKNSFIIVGDINMDAFLGTPFLTQIYPFTINCDGIHTYIIEFIL